MHRNRALIDLQALSDLFPHRIARAADLVGLGLSGRTISTNTGPGGPWQRLLPGILLLSNAPPIRPQLVQAALSYAGPSAVLTGQDALQLHGMRTARPGGPVHVLVPHDRRVKGVSAVAIERTIRLPRAELRGDFPVVPLERALLDATRRMGSTDGVRAILAEGVQRGRVRTARLRAELARSSSRGSAVVRRVLDEISDGIRSVAQGWARRLVLSSPLPKPVWNVPLCDATGRLLAVVDAWWDDAGLAWDIDAAEWHTAATGSPDTSLERAATLAAAGITVVRTTPSRVRDQPTVVLGELERALAHAGSRPRPRIRAG